jgi:hypothetical protein
VVLFCFAGRRANMELQLPLVRAVLRKHRNVEYHVWNLAHNQEDHDYIAALPQSKRVVVFEDYYGENPWQCFNDVYEYYTHEFWADTLFVKIDDDVVYFEVERFGEFLKAVAANRDSVVSAKVINNGACAPTEPGLWAEFEKLGIPLLDVHLHGEFADMSHGYAIEHFDSLVGQPVSLIPTEDWLSINMIGYDYAMGCEISRLLGAPTPERMIAGRFHPSSRVGDEGAVNMLSRLTFQGFLAIHLGFGGQTFDADMWRKRYAEC